MGKIENLSSFEKDMLLRKLLHHMDLSIRGKIMAEMPIIYVKMNPAAGSSVREHVDKEIRRWTS